MSTINVMLITSGYDGRTRIVPTISLGRAQFFLQRQRIGEKCFLSNAEQSLLKFTNIQGVSFSKRAAMSRMRLCCGAMLTASEQLR